MNVFKNTTKFSIAMAILFVISFSAHAEGDGYGANNGGNSGTSVTVTSASQLASYASSNSAYNITVSGTIDLGTDGKINVGSNTTIQGANTGATILGTISINGVSNVIIKNLNISAPTGDPGDNDGVQVRGGSTGILITKCSIYDCTDGNLDITHGGGVVTVSWCKFYYTRDNGHNFSNLVGAADDDYGTYQMTWHHNWWAQGCQQRMVATRFGPSHMYNNYWSCSGNDYCTTSRNICEMLSQNNYYDNVEDPLAKEQSGTLYTSGNIFNNCSGSQTTSYDNVFTPPYSYSLDNASSVPSIVMAGAGNVGGSSGGSYYSITNRNSGLCVGVEGGSSSDYADVEQQTCNSSYWRQQWELVDLGNGYLNIKNRNSSKCMRASGSNVVQYTCYDYYWSEMFERIDAGNGYYLIKNRSTGTCLRVDGSSRSDGASIVLYDCNSSYWSEMFSFSSLKSAYTYLDESTLVEKKDGISIYPNPSVSGLFKISLPASLTDKVEISIIDIQGKLIHKEIKEADIIMNINKKLSSGVYIVNIKGNSFNRNEKLLVE